MDMLAAIRRDSDRFYAAAETADPTRNVPSCPDWNIADLVWHLGEVHFFWATIIETRAENPENVEKVKPARPSDYAELVAWGRGQADRMIDILEHNDDATKVWTWALDESDHNVAFIRRHQVQEAAVHRWDMQTAATGQPDPIEPEIASDSLDEFVEIQLPWGIREDKPVDGSIHIHCTDAEGEWFIHPNGRVEAIHAKGDVAIRGTASDLVLLLYKRMPLEGVEVIGDEKLAAQFMERLDTE